jgi:PAS domain S-box-containing protein
MLRCGHTVVTAKPGIWIIDVNGQTLYANQRMAEILGTTRAELVGRPSFDYVFPEDIPAAQRLFDAKKHGNADTFHFTLRRKDGLAIKVDVQGTPRHKLNGRFNGIVGTFSVSD